jgi:hypothetical protein
MKWKRNVAAAVMICCCTLAKAQVTGGEHAMEFLRLPNSPHISALGGLNVSSTTDDIAFALQNPALMRPALHNQLGLNYNAYYAGISIMNLQYGYNVEKLKTAFALGVQYLNYGTFTQTDDIGNQYGDVHANDYALSLAASRSYGEHWRYGATLKWAHSMLYDKRASAVLADVGVNFFDKNSLVDVGIVAKNMGFMLKTYNKGNNEPLPFDLQIGVSKQFKHLPLRFYVTLHHLYEWDIRYDNPADVQTNILAGNDTTTKKKSYFADKLFRHFVFGADFTLGKRIVLTAAYNQLHRAELAIKEHTAMAGFSFGVGINLNKFQVHYSRAYYSSAGAYNEFGLNLALNKLFGLGKTGENMHWNSVYPDEYAQ